MVRGTCLGWWIGGATGASWGADLDGPAPVARQTHDGGFPCRGAAAGARPARKAGAAKANRAQSEYERRRGQSNIVLKARQMGISTWVAGRFFLKTITQPGTLTVQVAHTQAAAEGIFRCVHRFLGALPASLRRGRCGRRGRVRGRSSFRRWTASTGWRRRATGTRDAGRRSRTCTARRWRAGRATRRRRWRGCGRRCRRAGSWCWSRRPTERTAVFSRNGSGPRPRTAEKGWLGISSPGGGRRNMPPTKWRKKIGRKKNGSWQRAHGLTGRQIGFRRRMEAGFRGLARQEYAEDAGRMFSGQRRLRLRSAIAGCAATVAVRASYHAGRRRVAGMESADRRARISGCGGSGRRRRGGRLFGRPGDRSCDRTAVCRVAGEAGNAGAGSPGRRTGARIWRGLVGGRTQQSRIGRAGLSEERLSLSAGLRTGRARGLADFIAIAAGDDRQRWRRRWSRSRIFFRAGGC